jgi:opacity protein-like surface antigen
VLIRAQFGVGPVAGISISNGKWIDSGSRKKTSAMVAIRAGAVAEYALNKKWYLQSGAYYSLNGFWLDVPGSQVMKYRFHSVEAPLSLQYKGRKPAFSRFFAGVGLYASYQFRTTINQMNNIPLDTLTIGRNGDITRFGFGYGLNAGYQVSSGLFVRAAYQASLTDFIATVNTKDSYKNYQVNICLGYLLGNNRELKSKKEKEK